jgi:membrane associated rhomboid family serine protease
MCRNCGALVGANEPDCSLCGAPKASTVANVAAPHAQAPQHVYDHETVRFARAILGRPYIFTIVFIIANIFVFLLTSQSGAIENPAVLIRYGAKVNAYINTQHEWWRFVTPIFLHGGIAHLLMNMYGLWVIGPYVEKLYGSAKFVVFWVLTGVAGVVASYLSVQPGIHNAGPLGRFLFKSQDVVSVGASGALFGLIGVLFVFGIKFRHELPEGFKRAFGTGMLPTILLNIFIGYAIPVIDNAAHMGGLVMGALLALVVGYKRPGERAGVAVVWHILQVLALALVVVSFVMVARHFRDDGAAIDRSVILGQLPNDDVAKFNSYLNTLVAGGKAFVDAFQNGDKSGIDDAIEKLDQATQIDVKREALRVELKSLLARMKAFDTTTKPVGSQSQRALAKERQKLGSDFGAWQKKVIELVEAEGGKYRVKVVKPGASQPESSNSK